MVNNRKSKPVPLSVLFICLSVAIVIGILTAMSPMVADDYNYSFDCWNYSRISSLYELYMTSIRHYRSINSRLIAHVFSYFFLMVPHVFFDIANGINAALLTFTAYLTLRSDNTKRDCILLASFCALVWLFMPAFGQIFLWLDGSCNYSWGLTFGMAYMLPFIRRAMGRELGNTTEKALFGICAFVAGSYVENMAAAILFSSFLLMCFCIIREKRVDAMLIVLFILCCGGFSLLTVFAPALHYGVTLSISGIISSLVARFGVKLLLAAIAAALCVLAALLVFVFIPRTRKPLLYAAFGVLMLFFAAALYLTRPGFTAGELLSSAFWNLLILALIYCLCFFAAIKRKMYAENRFIVSVILALGGVVSVAVYIAAAYVPIRAFAVYTVFVALASLLLLPELLTSSVTRKISFGVLCAVFAAAFILGTADIYNVHLQAVERDRRIAAALSEGSPAVYLKPYSYDTKYCAQFELYDIVESPSDWPNDMMLLYYGVNIIAEA